MTPPSPHDVTVTLDYRPGLFAGMANETVSLPEYPTPYALIRASPDAPLHQALHKTGRVRIRVPADLRQQDPLFAEIQTQVTRTQHSQTPHIDFPHGHTDPRRFNMFWAESPRKSGMTYFIRRTHAAQVSRFLTDHLAHNTDVQHASMPVLKRYQQQPRSLSRYPLPTLLVDAYHALVFQGCPIRWNQLTPFGQTTICARVLGNTPAATRLVSALLDVMGTRAEREHWEAPMVVLVDDTRFFHGRLGTGETGGDFYRIWVTGPTTAALQYIGTAHGDRLSEAT